MILIAALLFCVYFLMGFFERRNVKVLFALIFVIFSFLLNYFIDETRTADYDNYLFITGSVESDFSFKMLFAEPYFFQFGNWLNNYYPKEQTLAFFYALSFVFSTVFFIWLAFLRNVSTFNKIVLFSLYYFFFAYIILRNAPAYMLTGVCFYYLHRNKYLKITTLSFLTHLTSLPAIFFSIFKNKLGDKKLIFMCFLYFVSFNLLIKIELFGLYEKFQFYSNEAEYGQSIFHKIYFLAFIVLNIYLFHTRRNIIFNYTYLLLFTTYLISNYANSVMGYRFSIYLILYLMINPNLYYSESTRTKLLFVAPVLLILFILNFITLQQ